MKNLTYLFLIIIVFISSSCASSKNTGIFRKKIKPSYEIKANEVPLNLIKAFQNKYPNTIAEEWYKISNYKYAVGFKKDGIYKYAYFNNIGNFQDEQINEELYYDPYDDFDWEELPDEYN